MRVLIRVFGLSCIFIFVCMIFMTMTNHNVRQDELNSAISTAMTGTQTIMQENIQDELYGTNQARQKIESEAEYKDLFIKNFARLVGGDEFKSSIGSDSIEKEYNSPIGTLPVLEKEGYKFLGWYTQPTGGTKITESTKVTGDTNVYAHWQVINYSITYNLNGGSVSGNPSSYTVETPTFTLKSPTKAGKTFKGWTWDGQTSPVKNPKVLQGTTKNLTFTAHYE